MKQDDDKHLADVGRPSPWRYRPDGSDVCQPFRQSRSALPQLDQLPTFGPTPMHSRRQLRAPSPDDEAPPSLYGQ